MTAIIPNSTLLRFLEGLSMTEFRAAPKGTGLKTAIVARECGLAEWSHTPRNWTFRLTPKGAGLLEPLRQQVQAQPRRIRKSRAKPPAVV
jgi:hypothetical protein